MRDLFRTAWPAIKWAVPLVVLFAVGRHFYRLLDRPGLAAEVAVDWPWLAASGLLYAAAQCLWGQFWVRLLQKGGSDVPTRAGLRAYFVSQLGKYVPGKVWVILIRVRSLEGRATRATLAFTATLETLTVMAAGAAVGLALIPWLGELREQVAGKEWLLAAVVGVPLALGVLHKLLNPKTPDDTDAEPKAPLAMLPRGFAQAAAGWALIGLAFWCGTRAVAHVELTAASYLRFAAMIALAYVIGFVAVIVPGGVGVREVFVQAMVAAELGGLSDGRAAALGVFVALALRLTWTCAELLLAGLFYWGVRPPEGPS